MPAPDPRLEAAQLYEEARLRRAQGNPAGALGRYRRALQGAEALGEAAWAVEIAAEIGDMYREAADPLEARRWYREALERLATAGAAASGGAGPERGAWILLRLALAEQLAGDLPEAERRLREALPRAEGDARLEGEIRSFLGPLLAELRRAPEGLAELARGLDLLETSGAPEAAAARERLESVRRQLGGARFRAAAASVPDPRLREILTR